MYSCIPQQPFPENGGNQGSAIGSVFDRFMKTQFTWAHPLKSGPFFDRFEALARPKKRN
jgi:hypothetical protein